MINAVRFSLKSLLLFAILNRAYSQIEQLVVPSLNIDCSNDLALTCNLQCPHDSYLLDESGCPKCECTENIEKPSVSCPQRKCRDNCGDGGYELDENGCQTCTCKLKPSVECSRVMCRMFCQYGFKRNENGCEYCACNDSPQACPQIQCLKACKNGYRIDYSGCQTCECDCQALPCLETMNNCTQGFKKDEDGCPTCSCNEPQDQVEKKCARLECDLKCKYGLQRDENGCKLCSCNRCSLRTCRMYCMYGFRRNEEGCEICECDWTPVSEKIQCSERIPCAGTRVCNINLKLCETVDPDRVNWFLYDFETQSGMYNDPQYLQTFKNGLINNIAKKYNLEVTQIAVSSVEDNGLTSFQIMPFFNENMEEFDKKMDQIDIDLNSHEFRPILPAIANINTDDYTTRPVQTNVGKFCEKFKNFIRYYAKLITHVFMLIMLLITLLLIVRYIKKCQRRGKPSYRSESKSPIYDTAYQPTPTEDDHYRAVHAPDGTQYVILESDDPKLSSDKRVLV